MPLTIPTFVSGTTIDAAAVRSKIELVEDYTNQGIAASDLKDSSEWVESFHIYKPEFYGSPSQRCEAVSGNTWYRHGSIGSSEFVIFHGDLVTDEWMAVPGLSATVRNPGDDNVHSDVLACFYAFTIAGSENSPYDMNEIASATFALFNGDSEVTGTRREIFASPNKGILAADYKTFGETVNSRGGGRLTRNNLSLYGRVFVPPGTSSVSVRVNLAPVTYDGGANDYTSGTQPNEPDWKHTFVGARSFIVNTHHLHS